MNNLTQNTALKLLQDFDLSVVIPLFEQGDEFIRSFPSMEQYYRRNGIEVVLVVGDVIKKDIILEFIRCFSMIDWKVIVNNNENPVKNPAALINMGIWQASKQYIMIMCPEWEFQTDVIYQLRKDLSLYPEYYAVGQVVYEGKETGCGGVMAQKEYFETIAGLIELNVDWQLITNNLCIRLELTGKRKLFLPEAIMMERKNFRNEQLISVSDDLLYTLLLPVKTVANNGDWGRDGKIVFDWKNNPFAEEQCKDCLSGLVDYFIPDKDAFKKHYELIALIPAYQESERIEDCLRSVEKHCDGIIVLDDESTDNTYERIQSEKLLLKAKKKRTEFNDKENRNILLDLAYFFRSEWFIFIDADERFDERFVDLPEVMKLPVDVVGVWMANLWDSMDTYRTDMGDSNQISQNGLWFRWRMFRNNGRMQITSTNTLHFNAVPYLTNLHISQSLILHLGYLQEKKRKIKYSFYTKEDNMNLFGYSDMLKKNVHVRNVNLLKKKDLMSDYPLV